MTKPEILEKIKEVATLLGQKSPSLKDMEKYAGLSSSSWKGKYWIRWSEALTEAGYQANQFSLPALGKEKYIVELLLLVRELQRVPQWLELRMRKQTDKDFPSTTAIKENFGGKTWEAIKTELLEYCEGNSAFSDLVHLFPEPTETEARLQNEEFQGIQVSGFVYLLQHGDRREYKIGKTGHVLRRHGEIAIELPEQVRSIHTIETDDPSGIEKYWHNRFKEKRKNGEWFELTNEDVKAFRRWKKIF